MTLWDENPKIDKPLISLAHPTRFERVTFAFGGNANRLSDRLK